MAAGLKVWDASGNQIIDITDRLTRTFGLVYLPPGGSGSVVENGFLDGTPFYVAMRQNGSGTVFNGTTVAVSITFSGNTMSYSTSQAIADFLILYGTY